MSRLYQIKKNTNEWEFANEASLEDFVWDNLEQLLGLKPLRRQHHVNGNFCDILAVSENHQLVIIELKNTKDRYVVQQLTRYYDALLKEKPFEHQIDYELPASLNILSPSFHKDNFTDCKYHKLKFDFLWFSISGDIKPQLKIQNLETNDVCAIDIPYSLQQNSDVARAISQPLKSFSNALSRCAHHNSSLILEVREKILKFDERLQETQVKNGYFTFGSGKTKICADFTAQKYRINDSCCLEYPVFALWLPISFGMKYRFSRVTLPSNLFLMDGTQVFDEGAWKFQVGQSKYMLSTSEFTKLCQKGLGRTQKMTQDWHIDWYLSLFLSQELNIDVERDNLSEILQDYCFKKNLPDANKSNTNLLNFFVEVALEKWVHRLET